MSSLIWEYEETTTYNYNYFIVDANNTNGVSLSSYENVNFSGDSSTYKTDLGDGTVDNNTSHTYSTAGTYIIKTKLQPGNEANKNNINSNITKCTVIRDDITDMSYFFNNCTKLSLLETNPLTKLVNTKLCFNNYASLRIIGISNWDLSLMKNISFIFKDCSNLTNVTFSETTTFDSLENGENVFYNCTKLVDTNLLERIS